MAKSNCAECPQTVDWVFSIQVGDKPGWKTPALNIVREDGSFLTIPISRMQARMLKEMGVSAEG